MINTFINLKPAFFGLLQHLVANLQPLQMMFVYQQELFPAEYFCQIHYYLHVIKFSRFRNYLRF